MTNNKLIRLRLHNQHLSRQEFENPEEVVRRMGALQAQDYRMVKWALGIRLPDSTKETVEQAIAEGTIIRTHLLRPTWHFVAAKDLRWLLKLTAPRVRVAIRSRHKQLGLTKEVITKSNAVIVNALENDGHLSRSALVSMLEKAGFKNKNNLASHLLLRAELDGLICSGPTQGKNYTYALLDERVPASPDLGKEEALGRLARTYFRSHGPATLEDFSWWSGLTKTSARQALEMISTDFISEEIGSQKYWFDDSQSFDRDSGSAYLLPAYDEFVISYRNRDMIIPDDANRRKAISNNGIFRPIIVVDGQITGIWKRLVKKETVDIELNFFDSPTRKVRTKVATAAERFAAFLGKELEITQL